MRKRFIMSRALVAEMLPTLVLATGITTFLLLIRVIFGLADFFISRTVSGGDALRFLAYSLPNIAALTLPIGMLFAVLMTSSRLSSDSELVAMQACGVRLFSVARPLLLAAGVLFLVDLFMAVVLMPAANRNLELLRARVGLSAAKAAIEPRVFIEEFPGYLLYVERIDPDSGRWRGILLFDQTSPLEEHLVIAKSGQLIVEPGGPSQLLLEDAVTHLLRPDEPQRYTRNYNREMRIVLSVATASTQQIRVSARSTLSSELLERTRDREATTVQRREARTELHKRVAIPAAILAFTLVGFPLGVRNRRGGKSFGLTVSVGLIVGYYVLLSNGEALARSGKLPPAAGMWLANALLIAIGAFLLRRVSRVPGGTAGAWWWPRLGSVERLLTMRRRRTIADEPGGRVRCRDDERNAVRPGLPFLSTLDRYVLRQCLGFFGLVLVTVCLIYIVVNLSDDIDYIQRNAVPVVVVVSHYVFMLPQILHDVLPLAFLISFLGTAAVLERHNETTAIKAGGVSLTRAALPLLVLGLAFGAGLFLLDESVVQRANRALQRTTDIIKGRKVTRSYRASMIPWMFLPDGRTLVNFLQFDPETNTLLRPSVYVFDEELNLRSRVMAKRANHSGGQWVAENAWARILPGEGEPVLVRGIPTLPVAVSPDYFSREYRKPQQMSFGELREYIDTLRAAGYRVDRLRVQLHLKLAYPLSMVVLAWLALPFAFRMGRRGTVMGIALALVLGMFYFAATAFVTKLGEAALLPPVLAAWTPTVIFALLAVNRHTTLRT